MTDIIMTRM